MQWLLDLLGGLLGGSGGQIGMGARGASTGAGKATAVMQRDSAGLGQGFNIGSLMQSGRQGITNMTGLTGEQQDANIQAGIESKRRRMLAGQQPEMMDLMSLFGGFQ